MKYLVILISILICQSSYQLKCGRTLEDILKEGEFWEIESKIKKNSGIGFQFISNGLIKIYTYDKINGKEYRCYDDSDIKMDIKYNVIKDKIITIYDILDANDYTLTLLSKDIGDSLLIIRDYKESEFKHWIDTCYLVKSYNKTLPNYDCWW